MVIICITTHDRFYQRNENGRLVNAPYVDNSYKWAGGGFMSTAEDLVQFGNSMLYSKQMDHNRNTAGLAIFIINGEASLKNLLTVLGPSTHRSV